MTTTESDEGLTVANVAAILDQIADMARFGMGASAAERAAETAAELRSTRPRPVLKGLLCDAPQNGVDDAPVCGEAAGHIGPHRAEIYDLDRLFVVEWHGHAGRCRAHLTLAGGTTMECDLDAGHDGTHRNPPTVETDSNGRWVVYLAEPAWWDDGRHEVRCVAEDCTVTISCRADPDDPVLEDWAAELGWDPVGDGWVCPAHVEGARTVAGGGR